MREVEPHVRGVAGLRVTETGIVNYKAVSEVYARKIALAGGAVQTGAKFLSGASANRMRSPPGNDRRKPIRSPNCS